MIQFKTRTSDKDDRLVEKNAVYSRSFECYQRTRVFFFKRLAGRVIMERKWPPVVNGASMN